MHSWKKVSLILSIIIIGGLLALKLLEYYNNSQYKKTTDEVVEAEKIDGKKLKLDFNDNKSHEQKVEENDKEQLKQEHKELQTALNSKELSEIQIYKFIVYGRLIEKINRLKHKIKNNENFDHILNSIRNYVYFDKEAVELIENIRTSKVAIKKESFMLENFIKIESKGSAQQVLSNIDRLEKYFLSKRFITKYIKG